MARSCILILGGARSGKSRFAQEMASQLGKEVLFVATGQALDEEMRRRIEEHKKSRPSSWRTIEAPTAVGRKILEEVSDAQVVIVDCFTLLVSNVIDRCAGEGGPEQVDAELVCEKLAIEVEELVECIESTNASFILISNEVGMGLVPENRLGRMYRDLLGKTNQTFASHADEVYLMVAGLAVDIKGSKGF